MDIENIVCNTARYTGQIPRLCLVGKHGRLAARELLLARRCRESLRSVSHCLHCHDFKDSKICVCHCLGGNHYRRLLPGPGCCPATGRGCPGCPFIPGCMGIGPGPRYIRGAG